MAEHKIIEGLKEAVALAGAAHTPGPWSVMPERLVTSKLHPIHCTENGIDAGPVAFATAQNAALIGAAPDMLAALKALSQIVVPDEDMDADDRAEFATAFDLACSVIAKAEGR